MNANVDATEFFKALSDPTRLKLVMNLRDIAQKSKPSSCCIDKSRSIQSESPSENSLCVCDLTELLNQPQPTVSRHLNHLKRVGIVKSERRGTWMWYELNNDLPEWCQKIIEMTEFHES